MVTSTVSSGPRYAPPDPTLPPPWRALVDGNTGYIYYWNPETNVTQYEKPLPAQAPPLPAGPPPSSNASSGTKQTTLPSVASVVATDSQSGRSTVAHSETPTGNLHGNSGGSLHGKSGGQTSVNAGSHAGANLHGSNARNSQGNAGSNVHGTSSGKVFGGAGGHVHGSVSANAVRSANGSVQGVNPAVVHGNIRGSTFGNASGPPHGSAGGTVRGSGGGNLLTGANLHSGNLHGSTVGSVPGQPKLAAIPVPRGQQTMGGMQMPPHSAVGHATGVGPGSSGPPGSGSVAAYKRSANDYGFNDNDQYKRPRTQSFSGPPATAEVEAYKRLHEVSASGDNVPAPFMTFEGAGFPSEILRELQAAGFTAPTPIQAQSWPVALQSRDIVAIAKTGSGKTLGYLLPAFLHLARHRNNSQLGPTVLVLAPTRELATQIQDEAVKFGRSSRISSTCVYGGAPKGPQLRDIERGADIVIATPGRLNDFLEVKKVSLRQVSYLVLDEADRMLDMGFEPQIRKIVNEIPPRRQTLMYTATWPKEVRKIADDLLVNPVQVNIGNADELTANKSITQHVEMVPPFEKQRRLEQLLRSQEPGSKIIIFCSTKKMCDELARYLSRNFGAAAIHGDKSQSERDYVLAQFKSGRSPVLVATDVAARGLDIKDIRIVINFDFPTGVEDYVHRIGRTGRAGATGIAYTFFSEQDGKYAKELIRVLEGASQKVPLELRDMANRGPFLKGRPGRWDTGGRGGRDSGRGSYGGGRGDGFGGRGPWGTVGQFDRRDRSYDRFGERDRFVSRDVGHNRPANDRYHVRDGPRRFDDRDRGRSYSRSPSRSHGHSRSRSPSYDRYSDDRNQRSPYRKGHLRRSRSPYRRSPSPYRGPSPYRENAPRKALSPYQSGSPRKAAPNESGSPRKTGLHESGSPHKAAPYESGSPRKAAPRESRSPHRAAPHDNRSPRRVVPPESRSPHRAVPHESVSPRKAASLYHTWLPRENASPSRSKSVPRKAVSPLRSTSPSRRVYSQEGSPARPHKGGSPQRSGPSFRRGASPHQGRNPGSLPVPRAGSPYHVGILVGATCQGTSPYQNGSPSRRSASPFKSGSPSGRDSYRNGSPSHRIASPHQVGFLASLSPPGRSVSAIESGSPSRRDALLLQDGSFESLSAPHTGAPQNRGGSPFHKVTSPSHNESPSEGASPH